MNNWTIQCITCDNTFEQNSPGHRTCEVCKRKTQSKFSELYNRKRYTRHSPFTIQCKVCMIIFTTTSAARKYCSSKCTDKFANRKSLIKAAQEQIVKQQEKIDFLRALS